MAKSKKKATSKKVRKPSSTSVYPNWLVNQKAHFWVLGIFSFLLYANTFSHEYTQDDAIVITDNMFTTEGVKGIPGLLKYDTFYGFFKETGKANLVTGGRYRPLSPILFAIEYQLVGKSPWLGHLMNAVYYALTVILLYLVLLTLFRQVGDEGKAFFIALVASLLFAAHPLHTEAVANIKGRDEILSLLGALGALYLSLKAFLQNKKSLHIAAGIVFFLALLAKENAITFLAIVPLAYYFFTKTDLKNILVQSAPFLVAAIAFILLRTSILGMSLGDTSMELMNNPYLKIENGQWVAFTPGEKLATVMYSLGKYIQLFVFPHPLTHDYYPRHIDLMSWGNWQVLLSLVVYVGLLVVAIRGLRKKDPLAFGILFFLLTLSIVSNVFFPIGVHMAERLMFMPSVGLCLVVAVLLYRFGIHENLKSSRLKPVLGGLLVVALLFSIKTITRNMAWADNYTLFTTDIAVSKNSAKLRNAVGGELIAQSNKETNTAQKTSMLQEAVGHLTEATKLHPTYKNAYLLMGNAYNLLQNFDASIQSYEKALKLDPNYREALNNLGITYRDAGKYYGETKGDTQNAIRYLTKAYEMRPKEFETIRLLGVAYGISQQPLKAIEYFKKNTELDPTNAAAWYDLGIAYIQSGDQLTGMEHIAMAKGLDPQIEEKRRK
ncbi:MAG: hypothetical protein DHS20C18_50060 [Saprospiraceae bacterium]|nr:MAG: hypothetical protein DHS20C18_50060 [Saprospiraceae bacterium]